MHRVLLGAVLAGTSDIHPTEGGRVVPPGRVTILSTPCRGPAVSGFTWHPAPPRLAPLSCPGDGVCSPHAASPARPGPTADPERPGPGVPSPMESLSPATEQTSHAELRQHTPSQHQRLSRDLKWQTFKDIFLSLNIWWFCGLLWKQCWTGLHTEHFRRGGNLVQTLSV